MKNEINSPSTLGQDQGSLSGKKPLKLEKGSRAFKSGLSSKKNYNFLNKAFFWSLNVDKSRKDTVENDFSVTNLSPAGNH